MSETSDSLKIRALEIAAAVGGESAEETVKRATSYHKFLSGVATATAPQSGTSAKGETSATGTSGKGNTSAATPPKNTAGAAGAAGKPGTAGKSATGGANKPAPGANKPAPAKQNVGAGGFPADDTKAPGAKNNFAAMCKKLRAVMQDSTNGGKAEASRILAEDGNGAESVRDLDPGLYDAVVEACDNVLNPGDAAGEGDGDGEGDGNNLGL